MRRVGKRYIAEVQVQSPDAVDPSDLVTKRQMEGNDNAYTGDNTHSGTETFLHATGVTTDKITERTSGAGITADSVLLKDGGVSNSDASMLAGFYPKAAGQALSGAGAINVTSYYTAWTTTAADAGTLADGTQIGQRKKIKLVVDGGDGTLTPTNLAGGTTITFNDANDYVELIWDGAEWNVIENFGCTVA